MPLVGQYFKDISKLSETGFIVSTKPQGILFLVGHRERHTVVREIVNVGP